MAKMGTPPIGERMKFGMWIMATGLMLGTGLFLMAVFDVDPWKDHRYSYAPPIAAGAPSPHPDDRTHRTCSSCHQIINQQRDLAIPVAPPTPPIASGVPSPHGDSRDNMACSKCHRIQAQTTLPTPPAAPPQVVAPQTAQGIAVAMMTVPYPLLPAAPAVKPREWHEKFQPVRFQGKILAVVGKNIRYGRINVNILVNDGINQPSWYNLAPEWYLQAKRCNVSTGFYVKGTSFNELGQPNALRYGQSLSVNGQFCQLRNSHMEGLWNPTTRHHAPGHDANEEADLE